MKTKQRIFDFAIFSSIVAAGIFLIPEPSPNPSKIESGKPKVFFAVDKDTQRVEKIEKFQERNVTNLLTRF
jgi:hypothetical protein